MKTEHHTVRKDGTIVLTDSSGNEHVGYVRETLAGETVEISIMDGRCLANHKGIVYTVKPYTGQNLQQTLFNEEV